MTLNKLKTILTSYGYKCDEWTEMPKILRFGLSDDSSIYLFGGNSMSIQVKIDSENKLIIQRQILKTNSSTFIDRIGTITDISKIAYIETNNPYSYSQFIGEFKGGQ